MNQTIFQSEMIVLTFVFCIIQLIIIFIHLGILFALPQKKNNWRFLTLVFLFLFYNLCSGLLPDDSFNLNLLTQNILAFGSGIVLATYFFYYLTKEFNIQEGKIFNAKFLFFALASSFIFGYIFTYLILGNFRMSKQVFIGIPIFISIYFCVKTVTVLWKNRKTVTDRGLPYKQLFISGYLGISFMATMPIVVAFGDFQIINIGLVNVSFFLILFAYYRLIYFESKLIKIVSIEQSTQGNLYKDYELSPREVQIALFLFDGLSYSEISEKMFISLNTATSYGSKMYKKTGTKNKTEFIATFKKQL